MLCSFLAFLFFLLCWFSTTLISIIGNKRDKKHSNLRSVMCNRRLEWMKRFVTAKRSDRVADINVTAQLVQSVSFFASTTLLVIFAITPIIGKADKIKSLLKFISPVMLNEYDLNLLQFKAIVTLLIFVYIFFKLTWALRQYNSASILLIGTPSIENKECNQAEILKYAIRNSKILNNADKHSTAAVNSYYYALVSLSWFLGCYIFIFVSLTISIVLYRREFSSNLLDYVSDENDLH